MEKKFVYLSSENQPTRNYTSLPQVESVSASPYLDSTSLGGASSSGSNGKGYRKNSEARKFTKNIREVSKLDVQSDIKSKSTRSISQEVLDKIEQYAKQNLNRSIMVEKLAEMAELSMFHFVRQFKKEVGIPPHKYLVALRMEHAKTLLRETQSAITEIALGVGYGSSSAFTYAFNRYEGCTPSQYRRSNNIRKKY